MHRVALFMTSALEGMCEHRTYPLCFDDGADALESSGVLRTRRQHALGLNPNLDGVEREADQDASRSWSTITNYKSKF